MIVDRTPYTYLIGWSHLNMWYYGVRFAKNCHPNDLWTSYKTSSKYVKNFVREHGDPNIVQVRKTFDTVECARLWEERVLTKLGAHKREDFLNKTTNISIYYPELTEEHRRCLRAYRLGSKNPTLSQLNKQKVGPKNPFFGRKHSKEWCESRSGRGNPMFGRRGIDHPRYGKQGAAKGKKWFYHPLTGESCYFTPGEQPLDFVPGRKKKG